MRGSFFRVTGFGCLVAFCLGVLYAAHSHALEQEAWGWGLADYLGFWLGLGLMSGACYRLVLRYPIRPGRKRNAFYHLAAAAVASPLHTAGCYLAIAVIAPRVVTSPKPHWIDEKSLGTFVLGAYPRGMVYYLLIVSIIHALTYYHRYEERALAASQLESQLAQAKLHLLKMQLHPHFLFNTLNSISALLREDVEQADLMIERMGDFLRLTLDHSPAQEVTLREELEFVACYLSIEQIRLQDRLTSVLDVEPRALDARVPALILQPVVENAIRYAISPRSTPGRIEIRGRIERSALLLTVQDDGPGLEESPRASKGKSQGMGLPITRARLERMYGDKHGFELSNAPGGGLIVRLEIPLQASTPLGQAAGLA